MMDHYSDEELAAKARGGEAGAFEELFHRHKRSLLNFIYRMVGNRETAEEVCHDAFIKAYKNLDIFEVDKKFSTWLYVIARNLARNAIRDRKYFRDISMDKEIVTDRESVSLKDMLADDHLRPDRIAQEEELAREAQVVLNSLPSEFREVITLCSIQGLSCKEAADIIRCSIATVSLRLEKAKRLFLKKLGISEA
ncbi:MAG: sigma-70 family RNA polymerase sigma factor [Candidatus Omnitrophica bacterium]|nr:sigma-70 family RNA polymerase sigma factor [Candidatus Omnitrophota bacterium]